MAAQGARESCSEAGEWPRQSLETPPQPVGPLGRKEHQRAPLGVTYRSAPCQPQSEEAAGTWTTAGAEDADGAQARGLRDI